MAKMIRTIIQLLVLALCMQACGSDKSEAAIATPKTNNHLLVFIDKSGSVTQAQKKFSLQFGSLLTPLLKKMVRAKGDHVEAHLVHGNTVGNPIAFEDTFQDAFVSKEDEGPQTRNHKWKSFLDNLDRFRKKTGRSLQEILDDQNNGDANKTTDVLGSLEVISNYLEHVPQGDTVVVYYVSDMVHSLKEPRNYVAEPLRDLKEAESCAEKDYLWLLSHRKVNGTLFNHLEVQILFPSGNTDVNQNDKMFYYWDAMFKRVNEGVLVGRN